MAFTSLKTLTSTILIATLTACGSQTSQSHGTTAGVVTANDHITDDEAALANDSNYISVTTANDLKPQAFNYQNWPLACDATTSAECTGSASPVGVKDVSIAGSVLVIDATQPPWLGLSERRNIKHLNIQADKVVVRGLLHVPSAQIDLRANAVVFEDNGVIDNTPVDAVGHKSFTEGASQAANGADGLSGQTINIYASTVSAIGAPGSVHLKANGGRGERAGDGWGQTDQDFAQNPAHPGDMPEVGFAAGVVYIAPHILYCDQSEIMHHTITVPVFGGAAGGDGWPAEGRDAIAGGAPGAGGAGGTISIQYSNAQINVASVAQATAGINGATDVLRHGTPGGKPNPSFHVNWTDGNCRGDRQSPMLQRHDQHDGAVAAAPMNPAHLNSVGSVQALIQNDGATFSIDYFQLKLKLVKDFYYNQKFTNTIQQVNELEDRLAATPIKDAETSAIRLEVVKIEQNLIAQKDYFGRGLRDAPAFTSEFELARYQSQVQHAIRSYYLAKSFARDFDNRTATVQFVRDNLAALSDEIATTGDQIDKADSMITSLSFQEDAIKTSEGVIQTELAEMRKRFEAQASQRVSDERKNKITRDVMSAVGTICEVLPVYQPALAAVGAVLKAAAQGPKTNDLQGWVDYGKGFQDDFGKLNDPTVLEQSSQSFHDFAAEFDWKNLSGKSASERGAYLKQKFQELAPKAQQIADAFATLKEPAVSDDQIQAVMAQLEAEDPIFPLIKQQLAELIEKKLELQKDILTYLSLVNELTSKMSTYIAVASTISDQALATDLVNDGRLKSLLSQIADDEEQSILFLYDEVVRAYNYTALTNLSHPMDLPGLREHVDDLLKRQNFTTEQGITELNAFYDVQLHQVRDSLSHLVDSGSTLILMHTNSRALTLSNANLKTLAKTGEIDIALTEDFYNGRKNVRIKSIEVDGSNYALVPSSGSANQDGEMSLSFSLGDVGDFNYPDTQAFVYPKMGGFFEWEHTFQKQDGAWSSQPNTLVGEYKGILSALVDGNSAVLQYSAIFSQHAGVTTLKIKTTHKDGPYVLKKLSVRVNYEYSMQ